MTFISSSAVLRAAEPHTDLHYFHAVAATECEAGSGEKCSPEPRA
jgi:hypothetical protein